MPPHPMMPPAGGAPQPGAPTPGLGQGPVGAVGPPAGPVPVPQGAQPNPAYAQWQQATAARQQVIQQNAQKQAQFDAACKLIRDDGIRGFKLDIEADSTIAPDEEAEKQSRTEFLKEIVPFLETVTPIAQGNPKMAKLVGEIGMFAIRGFRVARTLEEAFEAAFEILGTMPPPPPKGGHTGTPENPAIEQAKVQADVQDTQTKAKTDLADTQTKAAIAQATLAQKQQQANDQLQLERMRFEAEQQHNAGQLALEHERMASTERVQSARTLATNARGAGGLE